MHHNFLGSYFQLVLKNAVCKESHCLPNVSFFSASEKDRLCIKMAYSYIIKTTLQLQGPQLLKGICMKMNSDVGMAG